MQWIWKIVKIIINFHELIVIYFLFFNIKNKILILKKIYINKITKKVKYSKRSLIQIIKKLILNSLKIWQILNNFNKINAISSPIYKKRNKKLCKYLIKIMKKP